MADTNWKHGSSLLVDIGDVSDNTSPLIFVIGDAICYPSMSPMTVSSVSHRSCTHMMWHPAQFGCGPIVALECYVHMFSTTLLVVQGWSQLISLCPPAIEPLGRPFYMKRGRKCKQGDMCMWARPSEGLVSAGFENEVWQMLSELTLAVVRTDQCAGIWCMVCVSPDGTHSMSYDTGTRCTVVR
jgi:hypothetical protein